MMKTEATIRIIAVHMLHQPAGKSRGPAKKIKATAAPDPTESRA